MEPTTNADDKVQTCHLLLAAVRNGDVEAVRALLDPSVVMNADEAAVKMGAAREARGDRAVAEAMLGFARGMQAAMIGGQAGLIRTKCGQVQFAAILSTAGGKIDQIQVVADAEEITRKSIHSLQE